jgi:hypothetical protein
MSKIGGTIEFHDSYGGLVRFFKFRAKDVIVKNSKITAETPRALMDFKLRVFTFW